VPRNVVDVLILTTLLVPYGIARLPRTSASQPLPKDTDLLMSRCLTPPELSRKIRLAVNADKPYTESTAEDRLTCKDRGNPDECSSSFDGSYENLVGEKHRRPYRL